MSATINMKLTAAGQAAIWNAQGTGTQATLTHVQIGTGRRTPDGTETGLLAVAQTTTIAAGSKPSPTQIRVSCLFPGISNYDITEIGVWIGNPASGGKLFAYHSLPSGKVGTMVVGTDFVFAHEWAMEAATAAALNILADTGQSAMLAMMAAHEAAGDPHPQYATDAYLAGLAGTASPTMNGSTALVGTSSKYAREDHLHPSDSTKANKSGDTFTGAVVVNTGAAEAQVQVVGGSQPGVFLFSNATSWGIFSMDGGGMLNYDRATGKRYIGGIDTSEIVQNDGGAYSISISGNAATASTAENSSKLGSASPSYYTDIPARLGFMPVQQGTGFGQTNIAIKIGWGAGGMRLQVDSTDFGFTWPININGNAATATSASTAGNADTVDGHHADDFMKRSQVQFYPGDTGYLVMPPDADGRQIIRQWGVTADVQNDQMVSVTFPVTFPHACLHVTTVAMSDSGNYDHFALLVSKSNTGCVLGRGWITGNSVNKKLQWVAEGW